MLIYISVFISILLIVFLVFSLARDPEQVLKKRIKKIQYGIIKECIDNEDKVEWSYISRQLKARKKDLTSEILQSLKVHSKKKRKELDEFLEKNWNEIFSIFDEKAAAASSSAGSTGGNGELNGDALAAIRQMLEEVLQTTKLNVSPVVQTVKVPASAVQVQTDDVEEIEEVEEVEEIEEAEDLEDADAVEEIEEVESLDDAEEIEEVEEIPEVEELDEIEEIEEVSEAEEADVAESVDDAEEIEEVEEAEEIEDADAVEEIEEVEEAPEEVEEAETVDEAEEIEEAAEAEVTEEIPDEVEAVEEAEDVEEIEELEELDEVPEPAQHKFNPKLILMNQPVYIYKPGNETYFRSEDFATVENFNAEELELGSHVIIKPEVSNSELLDFQTYPLIEPEVAEEDTFETEDVEELAEAVENPLPYYSMTSFADNLASEMPVLEAASPENPIVENEGVFSISENLDYGEVKQDKNFKALVDSVL